MTAPQAGITGTAGIITAPPGTAAATDAGTTGTAAAPAMAVITAPRTSGPRPQQKKPAPVPQPAAPAEPVEKERTVRHVDTKTSDVNLDRYNEHYEDIAPSRAVRRSDSQQKKQKIKQKSQQQKKQKFGGKRETEARSSSGWPSNGPASSS